MANAVQSFIDSQPGVVLGTAFHTLGAVAFLGGLVGYLAWRRQLVAHGHHHRRVLEASAFLAYAAIVVNLLGGFMRTFESGHPHLTQFGESAWVRAIAVKHLFLFAGMGAAVWLFEGAAPRLLRAHRAGTLASAGHAGHRLGVALAALGILVAGFLGALAQVVPLDGDGGAGEGPGDGGMHGNHTASVRYANATGQLSSSPLQPSTATGGFDVPDGTVLLEATLAWSPDSFQLRLDLQGPAGAASSGSAGGGALALEVPAPAAGPWAYSIASDLAAGVQWSLSVRLAGAEGSEAFLADAVTIAPGQFFEINTVADAGAVLSWAWSADAAVHFDIHTHFDGEVQYVVEEEGDRSAGRYTTQRSGGHSYLWENTGALPVRLDYRVWGDFEVDSVFPA